MVRDRISRPDDVAVGEPAAEISQRGAKAVLPQATTPLPEAGPGHVEAPDAGMLQAFAARTRYTAQLEDLGDRHGIPGLTPGPVEVWYLRDPKPDEPLNMDHYHLRAGSIRRIDPSDLEKTHVRIGSIQGGGSPEKTWRLLNWEDGGVMDTPKFGQDLRNVILSSGLRHSSMSVGDLLRGPDGNVQVAAPFGFTRMMPRPALDKGPMEPWRVQDWAKEIMKNPAGVVFVDTETTGLDGSVVELAAVCNGARFHAYVEPQEPIHPKAAELTGLNEETLKERGARPWPEVRGEFQAWMAEQKARMLEAGVEVSSTQEKLTVVQYSYSFFDKLSIEKSDRLAGLPPVLDDVMWVDAMEAYQHAQALPKVMKLIEAAKGMDVELKAEDAHGAMADTLALQGIFQKLGDHRLDLGPAEVILHKEQGGLKAYDAGGIPWELEKMRLEAALGRAVLTWPNPDRSLKGFLGGAYVRVTMEKDLD